MPYQKLPEFDPYRVLGVSRQADAREIKTSYRRLCLQFHPDKAGPQSHETFVQIQEAYELLSDEQLRLHYDERGKKPKRHTRSTPSNRNAGPDDGGQDTYDNSEYEEEYGDGEPRRTRHQRRWYEKGSNKSPPRKADPKFRSRTWATSSIDILSKDLDGVESGFNALRQIVEKAANKSEPIWTPLQHISDNIAKKKSELKAVMEQVEGVAVGQWRDGPEIKGILAILYRLQAKVKKMEARLPVLLKTAQALESASEAEEKKRLKRLLRIQASRK
ncbi:hypothetical protein F5Y06DRAFT_295257 [Hypoxylon sp. FL0890]|nr:hypothetical protein F5Y06DRAFT_295257 [Hypoxylon sp. FL0890]